MGHSPVGASSMYRVIACAGSVNMSRGVEDDESDFAKEGTAAHAVGECCLKNDWEPWEYIGLPVEGQMVTTEMANAVAYYVNTIKEWFPERTPDNSWVERRFHCPTIHPLFFGTSDFAYAYLRMRRLHVVDYKHGAGIVVEAENNPQGMYYACGILEELELWDDIDEVVIHIVQPRGWHIDGQHRTWRVSTDALVEWLEDVCVPAMKRALVSRDTVAGEHCRFCPARSRQCPALMEAMAELEELMKMALKDEKGAEALTDAQLGRLLELKQLGAIVFKAAEKVAHGRLSAGKEVPGVKLVAARTNRVFKDGAEAAAKEKFGKKALTEPKLKSPAEIDEMPGGKEFTARWAFKPEGATTVAVDGDPRDRVIRDAKSLFKPRKDK